MAPPRLIDLGLVDTVTEFSTSYRVFQPTGFVNQYAAMPSLHMGWDLLIGIAVAGSASRLWLRIVGWLLPALMAWAVLATANHYLLDALAGVLLVLVCRFVVTRRVVREAEADDRPEPSTDPHRGQESPRPCAGMVMVTVESLRGAHRTR